MSKCQSCLQVDVQETRAEKVRTWILQKFFRKELQDYKHDFYTQGISQGYKNGFEQAMIFAKEEHAEQLRQFEVKQPEKTSFPTFGVEDVLTADYGPNKQPIALYANKEKMDSSQVDLLKAELYQWKKMRLRNLLFSTPEIQAKEKMFEKATSWDDMAFGKGVLYGLDIQTKIEDLIEQAKA